MNEKKYLSWSEIDPEVQAILLNESYIGINEHAADQGKIIERCMAESEPILDHLIKCILFADTHYVNHWKNEIWANYNLCIRTKIAKMGKTPVHYPTVANLTEWLLLSCVNDLSGLASRVWGDAQLYKPNPRVKQFEMDYEIGTPYDSMAVAEAIWQFYMRIFEIPQETEDVRERQSLLDQAFQDIIIPAGKYEVEGRHSQGRQ